MDQHKHLVLLQSVWVRGERLAGPERLPDGRGAAQVPGHFAPPQVRAVRVRSSEGKH